MPDITLVGAGPMAQAYCKILSAQKRKINVIGRGQESANLFSDATGTSVLTGGLGSILEKAPDVLAQTVIVALPVADLAGACTQLITAGVRRILVEKPAGLNLSELQGINALARQAGADVRVALNRRFLSSVLEIKDRVHRDGGVSSFNFEFTEWGEVIAKTHHPERVKQNWFLANSLHVVDLAYFLGGEPADLFAISDGGLEWHSRASRFVGAGRSHDGATFSYQADWGAPGRWKVEVMTAKHRYILQPLEELKVQEINKVDIETVKIDDTLDQNYKPGLYRMVDAFLDHKNDQNIPTIDAHYQRTRDIYTAMLPEEDQQCGIPRLVHFNSSPKAPRR